MKKILVFDTETGGLDPAVHSILSLGAVVWDGTSVCDRFYVVINEPTLSVTDEALAVNGFTREQIEKDGVPPHVAVDRLLEFVQKNDMWTPKGRRRVTLGGHNVPFDVGFLKRLLSLVDGRDFKSVFSYRSLDTQALALFFSMMVDPPMLNVVSTGLDQLTNYFGVSIRAGGAKGTHNALEDAEATARLMGAFSKLVNRRVGGTNV